MNTRPRNKMPLKGVMYALAAAILFGVTTPLSKSLLGEVQPVMLAGLFYLGSGTGLALYLLAASRSRLAAKEASLRARDIPWLAGAITAGGIAAPLLLLLGLASTQATTASLFLNLEGVFTALIAWFAFRENFDKRILAGMIAIVLGGGLLSVTYNGSLALSGGTLLIAGACLAWAIDNNLTKKVAIANPAQIACLKGLSAGAVNIALALIIGNSAPSMPVIAEAMLIGFLGYGVSLVLFILALRHIGTSRTGAYFALAPFIGAAVAVIALREPLTVQLTIATVFMAIGFWLHLTEEHSHEHEHAEQWHEHEHVHDEHHVHAHGPEDPPGEPHMHRHKHTKLVHTHAHYPDLHHDHH